MYRYRYDPVSYDGKWMLGLSLLLLLLFVCSHGDCTLADGNIVLIKLVFGMVAGFHQHEVRVVG